MEWMRRCSIVGIMEHTVGYATQVADSTVSMHQEMTHMGSNVTNTSDITQKVVDKAALANAKIEALGVLAKEIAKVLPC